jgi:hypothetical protein
VRRGVGQVDLSVPTKGTQLLPEAGRHVSTHYRRDNRDCNRPLVSDMARTTPASTGSRSGSMNADRGRSSAIAVLRAGPYLPAELGLGGRPKRARHRRTARLCTSGLHLGEGRARKVCVSGSPETSLARHRTYTGHPSTSRSCSKSLAQINGTSGWRSRSITRVAPPLRRGHPTGGWATH